ncbi:pro-sigmaK processing inhibitor BofA family protein [Halococcus sp. IIIV-5B]|uniref:pro-sigmaK processing inhibitor BofA family protein n=1 Tax=Halococcus sp. IIIV-5B TaxID=2321230 RepID=UPI000E745467|nr:pro-sigmaK processing inhibitor BofA family protein [Halococcus sp. IIIV-5B]RJT04689.1 hypothetical protein D3261_08730 [Halococcus sp. IIIV-5B]
MVDVFTIGLIVLAVVAVVFASQILGSIRMLVGNAIGGIIILLLANWIGFTVEITPLTLIITALAGVPGAILILLLSFGGIAFVPPGGHAPGQALVDVMVHNLQQIVATGHELLDYVNETNSTMNATSQTQNGSI